jgi:hypothetical protein
MIQRFIPVLIAGLIVTGCVGQDSFRAGSGIGTTTGTTAGSTTGTSSANSCGELSGFTSLAACKSATYAQCYPSTKIIQNQTAVCYFPATGWEGCAANPAVWSYGGWSGYCKESYGIYLRSRTATCQRTLAACECITDSVTQERCSYGTIGSTYPGCTTNVSSAPSCNATPTPVPTATPASTPSWCSGVFLNYEVAGNNSASVLLDANNSRYSNIISFFQGKGYVLNKIRSSSYSLSSIGAITSTDRANSYVVQIEGSSSGCFLGKKVNITIRLYKGGIELTNGSETTACVSFGNETGRAVDRALSRMSVPVCQ